MKQTLTNGDSTDTYAIKTIDKIRSEDGTALITYEGVEYRFYYSMIINADSNIVTTLAYRSSHKIKSSLRRKLRKAVTEYLTNITM